MIGPLDGLSCNRCDVYENAGNTVENVYDSILNFLQLGRNRTNVMHLEIGQKENQYAKQGVLDWKADSTLFFFCSHISSV